MSEWITHDGKSLPVPPDTLVHVRFYDGSDDASQAPVRAAHWGRDPCHDKATGLPINHGSNWIWTDELLDNACIVAYRIWSPS